MSNAPVNFSIVEINRNKLFDCEKGCYKRKKCDVKPKFSIGEPLSSAITATEIVIDVHNRTDSVIKTYTSEWYCIDENSFAWQSQEICDEIWRGRCLRFRYGLEFPPNCSVRVYLYFPELVGDVASVLYLTKNCTLEICSDVSKVSRKRTDTVVSKSDIRIRPCVNEINKLEQLYTQRIFALTPGTIERIDLDIGAKRVEIQQMIKELPISIQDTVIEWYEQIVTRGELNLRIARDLLDLGKIDSISYLYSMSPRDFEEWTGDLFRALGYEVVVTPYSSDGGIDVICTKDSDIIGIQCKRYNGIVVDSLIYDLHKAMLDKNIKKGCFVTTGFFAVTAINAAKELHIELYDRTNLSSLIKMALK